MTSFDVIEDEAHRRWVVGGEPMIFHCHHYNVFLQRTLLDAEYLDTRPLLVAAGTSVAYAQLRALFFADGVQDRPARARIAADIFRWAGFGRIDFTSLTAFGGMIEVPSSHYALGWKSKWSVSAEPVCFFVSGFVAGALAAIFDEAADAFEATESSCAACMGDVCAFEVRRTAATGPRFTSPGLGELTTHVPRKFPASPVDYDGVYRAVAGLPLVGDADGVIQAFGVLLTRHYANYYNLVSFEMLRRIEAEYGAEGREAASALLVEAGRVCAFNTFGGIMTSTEWNALIRPTLATREDWVHGMVAVVNALGWGRWQVLSVSEEEAVFAMHDDYESVGYLAAYGRASGPVSFLAQGGVAGLMSLVYTADIASAPTLDEAFYDATFRGAGAYAAEPVESRAMGHALTTFRVRRE